MRRSEQIPVDTGAICGIPGQRREFPFVSECLRSDGVLGLHHGFEAVCGDRDAGRATNVALQHGDHTT